MDLSRFPRRHLVQEAKATAVSQVLLSPCYCTSDAGVRSRARPAGKRGVKAKSKENIDRMRERKAAQNKV